MLFYSRLSFFVRLIVVLALCGCFLGEMWHQFKKFSAQDTTQTYNSLEVSEVPVPAITLCPLVAYNYTFIETQAWDPNYWIAWKNRNSWDHAFAMNRSASEWTRLWDASTFHFFDFVEFIHFYRDGQLLEDLTQENTDGLRRIKIDTNGRGSCFTAIVKEPMRLASDYIQVQLRIPDEVGKVVAILHKNVEEAELMVFNYWVMQPFVQTVQADYAYNFELSLSHIVRKDSAGAGGRRCDPEATQESSIRCIIDEIVSACQLCNFPYFRSIIEFENLTASTVPVCRSKDQVNEVRGCLFQHISTARNMKCRDSCNKYLYHVSSRNTKEPGSPQSISSLWIYFAQIEIEEQKEYVLFDFPSIVAATGGSLGLFLGFSFLDFSFWIIDFVASKCTRGSIMDRKVHLARPNEALNP